jgi:hypothetical protein
MGMTLKVKLFPSKFVEKNKKINSKQGTQFNGVFFNNLKNEPKLGLGSKTKPNPILSCCNHPQTTLNIESNSMTVGLKKNKKTQAQAWAPLVIVELFSTSKIVWQWNIKKQKKHKKTPSLGSVPFWTQAKAKVFATVT